MTNPPTQHLVRFVATLVLVFVVLQWTRLGSWGIAHGQTAPGHMTPVAPSAATPASFPTAPSEIPLPTLAPGRTPLPVAPTATRSPALPTQVASSSQSPSAPQVPPDDLVVATPTVGPVATPTTAVGPGIALIPTSIAVATASPVPTTVTTPPAGPDLRSSTVAAAPTPLADIPEVAGGLAPTALAGEALIGVGIVIVIVTGVRGLLRR